MTLIYNAARKILSVIQCLTQVFSYWMGKMYHKMGKNCSSRKAAIEQDEGTCTMHITEFTNFDISLQKTKKRDSLNNRQYDMKLSKLQSL